MEDFPTPQNQRERQDEEFKKSQFRINFFKIPILNAKRFLYGLFSRKRRRELLKLKRQRMELKRTMREHGE